MATPTVRAQIITTVAGNNQFGFNGDGGPATSASLFSPGGVALDGSGNLFIADLSNNRIRRVSANGIITTVAGTGAFGFSGDGGLATNARLGSPSGIAIDGSGNLFIADRDNDRIRRVSANGIITKISDEKVATPIYRYPAGRKQRGIGSRAAIAIETELVVTRHGGDNLCLNRGGGQAPSYYEEQTKTMVEEGVFCKK